MSLREVLSDNLRRLCAGEDSIAAVCRATHINRQQFNRYLSATSLPNQQTRARICRHFRIDEPDLFREADGARTKGLAEEGASWSFSELRSALKLMHSEAPTSLTPGLYYTDFAIPHDQSSIMRSTLVIKSDGNLTTFRRLTGLSERRGSWWSHFLGDHKGIVLERRHLLYLIGLNARGNREPTLIVLRWLTNSEPMLSGHAMVMNPPGPTITAVVVHPCGPTTGLRAALRSSHAYSTDDPNIEPIVVDALDQQCQALVAMTRRLDLAIRTLADATAGRQF